MTVKSRNNPFIYKPPQHSKDMILYSDDYILIINKPSGLLSVPGRGDHLSECVESRVLEHYPEARIVHRLDMDTSGLMVMAQNKDVLRILGRQFEKRKVKKSYIAKLWGRVEEQSGVISKPLRCDWPNRPRQIVDFEQGKEAITEWVLLAHDDEYSRVRLKPQTGRTHQLRVHMQDMGYPILGDDLYAHDEAYDASERLTLHAEELGFYHPENGEIVSFRSECPF